MKSWRRLLFPVTMGNINLFIKSISATGFCLLLLIYFPTAQLIAQDTILQKTREADSIQSVNKARIRGLMIGGTVVYAGAMTGLYQVWYKDYPQSAFHFYNDNCEWLQIDKVGHSYSAYKIGMAGFESLRWAGVDQKKSAWIGGSMGFVFLTVIEILDGFSAKWGASVGDLVANSIGSAAFISQQLVWNEQRLQIKWSVHLTDHAQFRPEQLGSNFPGRVIKDYNGHTYWLSGNIYSFLKKESRFPKWLNVAVGYGGEGMTGGNYNPSEINGIPLPYFERYRQFYIAPDIDLSRIHTRSQTLNRLLKGLGILKFPLPSLEFSKKGVKFHPLYF